MRAYSVHSLVAQLSKAEVTVLAGCDPRHSHLEHSKSLVIAHALVADDASEDGTGRGTPLVVSMRGRGTSSSYQKV